MDRFICVRLVQANALDLSLFQFDYDLTFAAFFLNADKTIYGRFGSRSSQQDATRDISIVGFQKSLQAALELHKNYPGNKESLAGKQGRPVKFKTPESIPSLQKYTSKLNYGGKVANSCIHCHQIRDAERLAYRKSGAAFSDKILHPWPMPDVLGMSLDAEEKAEITNITPDSAAAQAGLKVGDEILTAQGQPILSIADFQWVMHHATESTNLNLLVRSQGKEIEKTLVLAKEWRRQSDISWRTTTWDLRRMGAGGLVLEDLSDEERKKQKLGKDSLALHVKHVGQFGEHAESKRAGFKRGDIFVAFDGKKRRLSETDFLTYILRNNKAGVRVPVVVLRGRRHIYLKLPVQ